MIKNININLFLKLAFSFIPLEDSGFASAFLIGSVKNKQYA